MSPKLRQIASVPNAPKAVGPYSPAVEAGNLVFLSGQVPIDPATGKLVDGGIEAQIEQVMKNLHAVLAHSGLTFESVAKAVIFLTDLKNFQIVNERYAQALGGHKPARSTIQVAALPLGAQVEIEMIAVKE